jgi:hypothetical protein
MRWKGNGLVQVIRQPRTHAAITNNPAIRSPPYPARKGREARSSSGTCSLNAG